MTLAQELMQRGQQQGIHQGEVALMTRLLKRRFHQIPETYLTRIQQADAETILKWAEKILDAKTLDEIFQED